MLYQPYFSNASYPYLGAVPSEIWCNDVVDLPADAKVVRIVKPYKNIVQLSHFTEIEQLDIDRLEENWVPLLQALPNLQHLRLSYCKKQEQLPKLSGLESLRVLMMVRCRQLKSLDFLSDLPHLHSLCLSELKQVSDLSPVTHLTGLCELWIDGSLTAHSTNILESVGKLKNLQFLHFFSHIPKANRSLKPLFHLSQLTQLHLIEQFSENDYKELLKNLPQLNEINFSWSRKWTRDNV